MSMILAATPGLAAIGLAMLAIGILGLMFSPVARGEVWRVFATGLVVTLIGGAPALLGGGVGAAHAEAGKQAAPVQQVMLSGMGSQIIYE